MDVQVIRKDGKTFLLSESGFQVRDFIVSSIDFRTNYGEIEGRYGKVDYGAEYSERDITVPFWFRAEDAHDFTLMRDELFELLNSSEAYYIRELRLMQNKNKYVGGKRYLVRLKDKYSVEQTVNNGLSELVFETTELPFAESIGTTQDIQLNGLHAEDALWGFGMGLQSVDETLRYSYNSIEEQRFRIYNAGNAPVHPFDQDFKMTISDVVGSTERFQITNHTNGSRARINVPLKESDQVIYDGPKVTRNGLEFLRDTRKDFVELSPGWNEFEVFYCDSALIDFNFRFYYK